VAYWYKQNLLLFASEDVLANRPDLAAASTGEPLPLVHPELLRLISRTARPRVGRWLKMAPQAIRRSLRAGEPRRG
jgi:hypothetical protein